MVHNTCPQASQRCVFFSWSTYSLWPSLVTLCASPSPSPSLPPALTTTGVSSTSSYSNRCVGRTAQRPPVFKHRSCSSLVTTDRVSESTTQPSIPWLSSSRHAVVQWIESNALPKSTNYTRVWTWQPRSDVSAATAARRHPGMTWQPRSDVPAATAARRHPGMTWQPRSDVSTATAARRHPGMTWQPRSDVSAATAARRHPGMTWQPRSDVPAATAARRHPGMTRHA